MKNWDQLTNTGNKGKLRSITFKDTLNPEGKEAFWRKKQKKKLIIQNLSGYIQIEDLIIWTFLED